MSSGGVVGGTPAPSEPRRRPRGGKQSLCRCEDRRVLKRGTCPGLCGRPSRSQGSLQEGGGGGRPAGPGGRGGEMRPQGEQRGRCHSRMRPRPAPGRTPVRSACACAVTRYTCRREPTARLFCPQPLVALRLVGSKQSKNQRLGSRVGFLVSILPGSKEAEGRIVQPAPRKDGGGAAGGAGGRTRGLVHAKHALSH